MSIKRSSANKDQPDGVVSHDDGYWEWFETTTGPRNLSTKMRQIR